jgi:hypothetical protein
MPLREIDMISDANGEAVDSWRIAAGVTELASFTFDEQMPQTTVEALNPKLTK